LLDGSIDELCETEVDDLIGELFEEKTGGLFGKKKRWINW